jgi:sugar lactone lactonase YvrE
MLHSGFRFTEGPAAGAKGDVYFNDIPNEKLHKIDVGGELALVREGTNRANGLFFHGNGDLYACEGGAVLSDPPKPNGILLSPDEKTLYVVRSGHADIMAYRVEKPGVIDKGRRFFTLKQPKGKTNTGGDGLTVDEDGNLYVTSWLGIQVISPGGKLLRILEFPEKPANCTFGGKDRKTLYVTARTSVYTMRLEARGHVFPAGS